MDYYIAYWMLIFQLWWVMFLIKLMILKKKIKFWVAMVMPAIVRIIWLVCLNALTLLYLAYYLVVYTVEVIAAGDWTRLKAMWCKLTYTIQCVQAHLTW